MKSYYYFVRTPNRFGANDVVYDVAVGTSKRDLVKLSLVQEWCHDSGAYFKIRSDQSAQAIHNLGEQLFKAAELPSMLLRRKSISISELYKRIIDWSWDEIENDYSVSLAQMMPFVNTKMGSIIRSASKGAKNFAFSVSRKYLSDEVDESPLFAAINFGLILALFLFSSWLDSTYSVW